MNYKTLSKLNHVSFKNIHTCGLILKPTKFRIALPLGEVGRWNEREMCREP